MSLPPDADAAMRATESPASSITDAGRARILVIDDDDGIRRVMRRALDDHEVVTANDGVAALTLLATSPDFDLILCDVVMPNMGGVEFWHVMAATRPDILDRIVFMTGGALMPEEERFLGAGLVHVMRKPFAFGVLRNFVAARVQARLSP